MAAQQCEYFIDDLPEVLNKKNFPPTVNKILFHPSAADSLSTDNYMVLKSWSEIDRYFLGQHHEHA